MCVLGMHEELRPFGIAVNSLWPRTAIWTAAMDMLSSGMGQKVTHFFFFNDFWRKKRFQADSSWFLKNLQEL